MQVILVGAVASLMLGHVLRALRHATLFPARTQPGSFHLTVGLSLAYVIDALLPFRVGEVARSAYVSARAGQSFGMVCATVIVERLSDLAVVAAILFGLVLLSGDRTLMASAAGMALMALALFAAAGLIDRSSRARSLYWSAASVFNERVRLTLVETAWTATKLICAASLLRPRYLLLTGLMWTAYLFAYALLAAAIGMDLPSVTVTLLASPFSPLLGMPSFASDLALVTSLTAILILVAGLLADAVGMRDTIRSLFGLCMPKAQLQLALSGHSFAEPTDYGAILDAHFTGRASTVAHFGLYGLDGAIVRHLLPGGSDAITAVVDTDQGLAIRKFANGDAGRRLQDQVRWLGDHKDELPLAEVVSQRRFASKFHYDMPFLSSARDLYDAVHIMPPADSRRLLEDVVGHVGRWHANHAAGACPDEALSAYIDRKIIGNARAALDFARARLPESYRINGVAHGLGEWDCLLDGAWAGAQMPSRATGVIHGDLTIENIIVCPERPRGWYLIDPNPGNLFDTPLIDWSKLMQSLNLGYEALNRGTPARVQGDEIDVMFHRSRVYSDLHSGLREQLRERLGADGLRQVAFHEIVNYLRLIPYKIRQNPAAAMTFFASASLLLRRYKDGLDG